ncbi:MAG: hypothetical protein MUF64_15085 [Polyangiaceae bacterium]|nr:hypothetical protein [Polyangiaceae bacterium]
MHVLLPRNRSWIHSNHPKGVRLACLLPDKEGLLREAAVHQVLFLERVREGVTSVEPLARRGPLGKEDFPGGMQVLPAKTAAQGEEQAASRVMFKEGLVETRGDREENLQEKVEAIWAGKEAHFQGQQGPPVRAKAGAQGRGKVESKALETEGMEGVICVNR